MSEQIERDVGRSSGDEIPAAVPVVVGGGGGPERGRSPSGGEPPPPTTAASSAKAGVSWAADELEDLGDEISSDAAGDGPQASPVRLGGRYVGRSPRLAQPAEAAPAITPQQRLLLLDTWQRSGLPAGDFADLVGINKTTLLGWQRRFDAEGPAGLMDKPKGVPPGSKLPELTRRTILMLKTANPDWGCQRISDMLLRGPALPASASAVARVLHEAGYILEDVPTRPHPDHVRSFERAKPNQLWQTDLFTFMLDYPS